MGKQRKLKTYTIQEMPLEEGYAWHNIRIMYPPVTNKCTYFLNESMIIECWRGMWWVHSKEDGVKKASKEEAYLYWLSLGGAEWER